MSISSNVRLLQMVGPLMAYPAKPLIGELQAFLDSHVTKPSTQADQQPGAVYVSMGTAVRLTEPEIRGKAANLAALHRPVLWKISDAELPGKVYIVARVPGP